MPLAEIGPLLDADPERFAAALADVERHFTDGIEELIDRRRTLRRLASGDRMLLPDRLRGPARRSPLQSRLPGRPTGGSGLGPGADAGGLRRLPDSIPTGSTTNDYVDLQKRCCEAESWDPDDPRVEDLASALSDNLLANRELLAMPAVSSLDDPGLTPAERIRHRNLKRQLLRDMNEMTGQLPNRTTVELAPAKYSSTVEGVDPNLLIQFGTQPNGSSEPVHTAAPEPARSTTSESYREPAPVTVSDAPEPYREPIPEPAHTPEPYRGRRDPQYRPDPEPFSLDPASKPGTPENRSFMRFLAG